MKPSAPPPEIFRSLNVSRESQARLEDFVQLLLHWQSQTNLIASSTIPDIWHRHILDSLQLLPFIPAGANVFADLGSGAGFPALPIAIASGLQPHLYESNGKKAAFLREALRVTNTQGFIHTRRIESYDKLHVPLVQFVTARALAPLVDLLDLAMPFLENGAIALFHKGQDVEAELTQATKYWRIKFTRHPSSTDSRASILKVEEAHRV